MSFDLIDSDSVISVIIHGRLFVQYYVTEL